MAGNPVQKELFEEYEKSQRSARHFQEILPKRLSFVVTLETAVFLGIGILMAMVLAFALGVEKGARQVVAPEVLEEKAAAQAVPSARPTPLVKTTPTGITKTDKSAKIAERPAASAFKPPVTQGMKKPAPAPLAPTGTYTIQIATFRNRQSAEEEAARLKKSGYTAAIALSGEFYAITVGNYAFRVDAERDLKRLRPAYSDCYIRKR